MTKPNVYIGVAGWAIPPACKHRCPGEDSHLQRYSRALSCVETNSSYHREHQAKTYERWANSVPENFGFSVKLSKIFTHEEKLRVTGSRLRDMLAGPAALGAKWRVLLVQLPPSLEFDLPLTKKFVSRLVEYCPQVKIAWEPRHKSWAQESALRLLADFGISKVLADPEKCILRKEMRPMVEKRLRYYRLHGSPVVYRSSYPAAALIRLADKIRRPPSPTEETWVTFDNTGLGHGTENALDLKDRLDKH